MENKRDDRSVCFDFEALECFDARKSGDFSRERFLEQMLERYASEKYKKIKEVLDLKPCVVISEVADMKVRRLLEEFPKNEWGCFLVGEKSEDKKRFYVRDIEVVKQDVSSVSVDMSRLFEGNERVSNVIGWLHSHNSMNVFFSSEDMKTAGMFDVSVVVNVRGDILACARLFFEDFALLIDCDVVIEREKNGWLEEWVNDAKSKINVASLGFEERGWMQEEYCCCCYEPVPSNEKFFDLCDGCGGVMHLFCAKRLGNKVFCSVCFEEEMYDGMLYGGVEYELE